MMVYATPEKVLISREEIAEKVAETAAKLADEYRGKKPLVVCVLNGAAIFFADLIRGMDIPLEVSSVAATSYGDSTESSGEVRITKDIDPRRWRYARLRTSRRAGSTTSRRTMCASRCRTGSSSAMGWIARDCTATCPT